MKPGPMVRSPTRISTDSAVRGAAALAHFWAGGGGWGQHIFAWALSRCVCFD
jgi:hypothetical protein